MMKKAAFACGIFFLTACSSVWVVHQDDKGGVIGYSGFTSRELAEEAVKKLVHCPSRYQFVSDERATPASQNRTLTPTTSYSMGGDYTEVQPSAYVPIYGAQPAEWRKWTYHCR